MSEDNAGERKDFESEDISSPGEPPSSDPVSWYGSAPDEDKLAAFVVAVHNDLNVAVNLKTGLFQTIWQAPDPLMGSLPQAMDEAWREASAAVPSIVAIILSRDAQTDLERVGLSGAQLDFKILAWHQAREPLLDAFANSEGGELASESQEDPTPGLAHRFRRLMAKLPRAPKLAMQRFAKVLGYADVILDSLASVILIAEPFKEFKQMTEKLAQDAAEGLPPDKH